MDIYDQIAHQLFYAADVKSQKRLVAIKDKYFQILSKIIEENPSYTTDYANVLKKCEIDIINELLERSRRKKIIKFVTGWMKKYPKTTIDDCLKKGECIMPEDIEVAKAVYNTVSAKTQR